MWWAAVCPPSPAGQRIGRCRALCSRSSPSQIASAGGSHSTRGWRRLPWRSRKSKCVSDFSGCVTVLHSIASRGLYTLTQNIPCQTQLAALNKPLLWESNRFWSLMLNATLCHKSSEGGLLNYRQRCEQKALLTTSVMAVVNQCRSVLPLDAQTLLNRCCSITPEHRLIFQAGPIADTWHLLTWKPLDCDCGSMAPLRPSLSWPWLLYCSPQKNVFV